MWRLVAQSYWFAAPVTLAAVLHMAVVKRDLWPALKAPLDGGASLGGRRIFGDNKTWRGVVVMAVASAALGAVQGLLFGRWAREAGVGPIDYAAVAGGVGTAAAVRGYMLVAGGLGAGYALGELPNSFLKRRLGIGPGEGGRGLGGLAVRVLDHADSALFAIPAAALVLPLGLRFCAVAIVSLAALHLALVLLLWTAGLKRSL